MCRRSWAPPTATPHRRRRRPRRWRRPATTVCSPPRCWWCWRCCWCCWRGGRHRSRTAATHTRRERCAICAAWAPRPPPSCPEAHVRLIRAAPAPRVRTFAYLLEQNMPISFRRAPRAPRPCVAVLAALSLSATAFAGAAPGHRPPPDARTLDAVEVQGHRSPIDAERALTPGGVSIVDGDSFHLRLVTNLADALRYVPGVWVESSTGGDAVFLSSRGSNLDATGYDSNGVKLFQDGLPVSTADGNNHNRFLDPVAA